MDYASEKSATGKPGSSRPEGSSPAVSLAVAAITLLAALVRLRSLDALGITLDEGFSIFLARAPFSEFAHTIWRSELNMSPYYLLLRGWIHLGHTEWTIRMLGVVLSTATVPVVYLLGRRLFHRRTGMAAALLLAVHPYHRMLAQNARAYPLVILLVCLASLCFLQGLTKPTWPVWAAYAVFSAAAVNSHFFAVLVVVAQLLSLLLLRTDTIPWKPLLYSLALLAVLLLPCAIFMATNGNGAHVSWVPPFGLQQLRWLLYSLTLSKARSLIYVFLWCVAAWSAVRATNSAARWPYWFVFLWLLAPIALTVAASFWQSLLVERFLAICLPASVLLAAAGIVELASFSRCIALAALALIIVYSALAIRFYDRHLEFDEGWRQSSHQILRNLQPGDVVIAEGMKGLAFDYYRDAEYGALPQFQRFDSFASALPAPPPANIWILGWVRPNPIAPGAVPQSDDQAVQLFTEAHRKEYCPIAAVRDAGITRVWQLSRCSPDGAVPATVR